MTLIVPPPFLNGMLAVDAASALALITLISKVWAARKIEQ